MSHEATVGKPVESLKEVNQSSSSTFGDKLSSLWNDITSLGSKDNTAGAHLPEVTIGHDDQPYNPNHAPGHYDKANLAFAKQHFDATELRQLEYEGPQSFNAMIEMIRKSPPGDKANQQGGTLADVKEGLATSRQYFEKRHPN